MQSGGVEYIWVVVGFEWVGVDKEKSEYRKG